MRTASLPARAPEPISMNANAKQTEINDFNVRFPFVDVATRQGRMRRVVKQNNRRALLSRALRGGGSVPLLPDADHRTDRK